MSPKGTNNATCFLSACNTKCHAEDFEGEITGFKCSHTQSHRYTQAPHPSFLMQNASSPEPQTQFSTLLQASAVNSPARRGNRQHLSQATKWRNAVCVTAGFKVRLQPRCRKPKIPFYCDILKESKCPKVLLALSHVMFTPFRESISYCPRATKHLNVQRSASCQWAQKLGLTGDTISVGHYNTLNTSLKDDVMRFL